jgi:hypothetical protein
MAREVGFCRVRLLLKPSLSWVAANSHWQFADRSTAIFPAGKILSRFNPFESLFKK